MVRIFFRGRFEIFGNRVDYGPTFYAKIRRIFQDKTLTLHQNIVRFIVNSSQNRIFLPKPSQNEKLDENRILVKGTPFGFVSRKIILKSTVENSSKNGAYLSGKESSTL